MSNAYFAFRQFGIRQDRCAMKVSTDACIFGAWIPAPAAAGARMLDIGTGTGLLALMLAQRHETARIDAVELDANAASQAAENCADSIFADRLSVFQTDARSFGSVTEYQLIVSNPPFFTASLKGPDNARNTARHNDSLDIPALFAIVGRLLAPEGAFALLMPAEADAAIRQAAARIGLGCGQRLLIQDNAAAKPKRCCWLFSRDPAGPTIEHSLLIREGGAYTAAFRALLGSYYLLL